MTKKRFFEIYLAWLDGDGIDFQRDGIKKADALILVQFAQRYLSDHTGKDFVMRIVQELIN